MQSAAPSIDERMSTMPGVRETAGSNAPSEGISDCAGTPVRFYKPRGEFAPGIRDWAYRRGFCSGRQHACVAPSAGTFDFPGGDS